MSILNIVGKRERSNSFQREIKEVYISESAFSHLQTHRKKHITPVKKSIDINIKQDGNNFTSLVANHEADQSNQTTHSSPGKAKPMRRLKLMKTAIFDHELPGLMSERSSALQVEIEKKFEKNTISMPITKDPKWAEFKIIGSNIQSRSRSAICVQGGYLYVYGGYEVKAGQLGDFWRVNLSSDQCIWEKVRCKSKANPDRLSRMSSCIYDDKFYLFGGQNGCLQSNNNLWCFDFKAETWTLLKPNNNNNNKSKNNNNNNNSEYDIPPAIDSHCSVLISDRFYVMFGYFAELGILSNAVYEYSFTSNMWTCLFANDYHFSHSNLPKARFESAATYIPSKPNSIYAFGGTDGFVRMNDLWEFNLKTKQYLQIIPADAQIPLIRSGHQLFTLNDQIVVLGGIHDITWEVDDLCIFNPQTSMWSIVDSDTARRRDSLPKLALSPGNKEKSLTYSPGLPELRHIRSSSVRKPTGLSSPTKRQSSTVVSPLRKGKTGSMSFCENEDDSKSNASQGLYSPTVLVEQKRKEFLARKAHMLQAFEVSNKEQESYRDMSPTSEAMKNALLMIGNPMPSLKIRSGRLTDFGRITVSRFMQPLKDQMKIKQGKKPCARDGHRIAFNGKDKLVLFGGDRHNMSFNDIYQLDLELLVKKYGDFMSK